MQHYVTEKLYDALLAGAVPLYVGAPNVLSDGYINPDCVLMLTDISPGDEWFDLTTMTLRYDADTVSAT